MTEAVLLVCDEAMLGHDPTGWDPDHPEWTEAVRALLAEQYPDKAIGEFSHPERPERLRAIVEKLRAEPVSGTRWFAPEPAGRGELERVHTKAHVAFIESLAGRACWLDVDTTAVSPGSAAAAGLAAGAGVSAIEAFAAGRARRAFCPVRPPGHHALAERAMGFCLYNNVAVAAAHARTLGLERILVWDWDLHHGNGTQSIFYADPDVLFIDSHCAAPFYPGSGGVEEIGEGAGAGSTLNVPLPPGSGNAALLAVADDIVAPAAAAFEPELILVSAGFDGHYLDQTFALDAAGFAALAARACDLAEAHAEGRLVVSLEGGYNATALAESAYALVQVLAGASPGSLNLLADDPGLAAVAVARAQHAESIKRLARSRG